MHHLLRQCTISFAAVAMACAALVTSPLHAQEPEDIVDPDLPSFARESITKEQFMRLRAQGIGELRGIHDGQPADVRLRARAIEQMKEQEIRRVFSLRPSHNEVVTSTWTEIGPNPIPNGQTVSPSTPVSGRVTAIAIHPTDPDIVFVGAAQGGVYRSLDGGTTWTAMMDDALSLAVGSLRFAPSNPSILYIGTGEPNFSIDSFFGVGLYRLDAATSATPVLSGPFNQDSTASDVFTGRAISEIQVHPTDPDIVFVSTTSGVGGLIPANIAFPPRGIYRTFGGTTTPVFEKIGIISNASVRDIVMDPQNPNLLIANLVALGGGIYRSTDALSPTPTFTQEHTFSGSSTSSLVAEFAVVSGASGRIYYAAAGESNGRVYRSSDDGDTWTLQVDNNFCGGQCFYDIAIAVDPADSNRVYLGGDPTLVFGISTNNGISFSPSQAGVHVDTHVIEVAPSNPDVLYMGTDGGIYKSVNKGATWTPLNNTTFRATQFMGLAVHPTDGNFTIGGTQDNGTNMYRPDGTWNRVDFGDGGYAVIDDNATDVTNVRMYHTYFNSSSLQGYSTVSSVANAQDGFWSFRGCQSGGSTVNGITCNGVIRFYAPLEQGPGNPNTIYYGSDRLYRSSDTGLNHTVVSQNPIVSGVPITAIGIAPQNDNVRVVGLQNGAIFGTTTGANPLTDMDPADDVPNLAVARVTIDPNDVNTAYVTLSAFGASNVWKTVNLSAAAQGTQEAGAALAPTWTDASGTGLTAIPQVPVNSLVVDPMDSNHLYAGTDIGVYFSPDAGVNWAPFGSGLPRVAVFDLAIAPNRMLRIATHGRGMWEIAAVTPGASVADPVASAIRPLVISPSPLRLPGSARITFVAPAGVPSPALRVHDLSGRLVRTLETRAIDGARRGATWDGLDRNGRVVAAGMYVVTVEGAGPAQSQRVVVMR